MTLGHIQYKLKIVKPNETCPKHVEMMSLASRKTCHGHARDIDIHDSHTDYGYADCYVQSEYNPSFKLIVWKFCDSLYVEAT